MANIDVKAMLPIEKLPYDLKLELLENMDPRDVVELVKVNEGFRSIVLREPCRIFGKHVDYIGIWNGNQPNFRIDKFESWISVKDGRLAIRRASDDPWDSASNFLELKTGWFLFSKIRSCQKLKLTFSGKNQGHEAARLAANLLKNLHSVGNLEISVENSKANIEKYLTYLTVNHIDSTRLYIGGFKRNERMLGVLSYFVETKLKHCKRIEICDRSSYSFWYEPLSKIWTEMIVFDMSFPYNEVEYESLVDRIVTTGIPSSTPEAAILLWDQGASKRAHNSTIGLLSQRPEVCQIAHEDRGGLQEIFEKRLLNGPISESYGFYFAEFENFLLKGVYFIQAIGSNRECIYVTEPYVAKTIKRSDSFFFAKFFTIG